MKVIVLIISLIAFVCQGFSQSTCPPNIDFELGNFNNWQCFIGSAKDSSFNNLIKLDTCQPQQNRHELMSSKTDKDPYGNFPVLCPFGGNYSVRLGNDNTGSEAEGISYTFNVPSTVDTFTFTYFYAVVFEDPGHSEWQQPRFFVSAYEVATGKIINCAAFDYVATSSLPGFYESPIAKGVLFKNWTPVSLQFAGLMGKQVRLEFKNADCTLGGHFGYSYLDVSSGCTNILATAPYCIQTNSLTLNAPYGFQSYTWYNSTYTQVMGNSQSLTLSPPPATVGSFFVDATPYPGFGCRDTFEARVKPLSIPSLANCNADYYFCQYQQNALINAYADSGNVLIWYVGDTLTTTGSEYPPIIKTAITGDFVYYVSQKQLFGCEGYRKKITVHIVGFSNSNITINNPVQCENDNKFIFSSTASVNTNITYTWFFGDRDTLITKSDTPVQHHYLSAGNYYIRLEANYFNQCTSFKSDYLTVVAKPYASFNFNTPICEQQTPIALSDKSYASGWTSWVVKWWWNINSRIDTNQNPLPFIVNTAQPLPIKLVAITQEGCASDTTIKTIIVQHKPKANIHLQPPLCSKDDISIKDLSVINNPVNGEIIDKWNWVINNSASFKNQNIIVSLDTGVNKINLNVVSSYGCQSEPLDSSIYIYAKPVIEVVLNDSCIDKNITHFVQDSLNIVSSWHWNFGNGYYQTSNQLIKSYTPKGSYPFSVIGKTVNNCTDTAYKNLYIYDNIAYAGNDTLVAIDQPVYLNAHGYAGEKYLWTPSKGLSSDTIENPIAILKTDKQYHLYSITKEGCVKTSKVNIKRYAGPALYVATAFTPNGDKINDTLHIFPVGIKQFIRFAVYNRVGNLVFTTTNYLKGWDGTYNGQLQANDTYAVVAEAIDYKGNPLIYKGTVVLMR